MDFSPQFHCATLTAFRQNTLLNESKSIMHKCNLLCGHTTPSVRLHFEGGMNTHCVQQSCYECGPERLTHTCACQSRANSCPLCHVTAWGWITQALSHSSSANTAPQSLKGHRLPNAPGLCCHNGQSPPGVLLPTLPNNVSPLPPTSTNNRSKGMAVAFPPTPRSQSRPSHREPRADEETLDGNMWTQQELETRHQYISPHLSGYLSLSRSQRRR